LPVLALVWLLVAAETQVLVADNSSFPPKVDLVFKP
jgi:hypothetical protein